MDGNDRIGRFQTFVIPDLIRPSLQKKQARGQAGGDLRDGFVGHGDDIA